MHLKDLKKGVATGSLTGGTALTNDVALGTGQVQWPALFRAAQKAGVKYYFIEDESPTVLQQIPRSLRVPRIAGMVSGRSPFREMAGGLETRRGRGLPCHPLPDGL